MRLVTVDPGHPSIDSGVGDDQAIDMGESEQPADGVHRGIHRRRHRAALAQVADEALDVSTLDSNEWVEAIVFTPREPAPELLYMTCVVPE